MLGTFHYGKEVLITAAIVIKYNVYNMHYFDNNYLSQSQGVHYTYELQFSLQITAYSRPAYHTGVRYTRDSMALSQTHFIS